MDNGNENIRLERMREAMSEIGADSDSENNWTDDGKPTIEALRRITGLYDITVSERDKVYEIWKKHS